MQPGVTVALATVWLAVAAGVVGAVTPRPLRLSHDQYSPASPSHVGVQQDQADWRDHDPAKDQPLDLWIGSQRSISTEDSPGLSRNAERNFPSKEPVKDITLSKQNSLASSWQTWLLNIGGSEFAADKVDYGGMPETLPREVPLSEPDDPFVADDTFQDQGPGSVEIYKLDLSKEKALLTATTPSAELPTRNKSKAPKKVDLVSSKTKTTEIKSTTSPKTLRRQSNFFEEQRTETPVNRDAFGVGGVPELQVGCEGLAAWSHKTKRSIDTPGKEKENVPAELLLNVSSIVVDLNDGSYEVEDEEGYEGMDELFRIRKMEELAAKRSKLNRGDIDPVLNAHYLNDRWSDELPVRGDLGETATRSRTRRENSRELSDSAGTADHEEANAKRETVSPDDDSRSRGRRLLWLAEANTEGFADDERKRAKRIDWGFGEDEGVVSSNELQTVNERRRQHEMRHHQNAGKRDQRKREPNAEVDNIRREHERLLEQRQREEEERLRRMQQGGRKTPNRWQEEEERRREETWRRQYEEYRRRTDHVSAPRADDEEARRRQLEEQRRQDVARDRTQEMARRNEEERRRREEEERRRRLQEKNARRWEYTTPASNEDTRRMDERRGQEEEQRRLQDEARRKQEQYRSQQEAQRRREEEERKRASQRDPARNLSEVDRRKLEERRRQWSERERQENERRRQQDGDRNEVPANLMRSGHHRIGHPNELGQRDRDQERRMQEEEKEERRREQKLREYIARNRPINLKRTNANRNDDEYRRRAEEQRRRQEDELRVQDYNRRQRPLNVPTKSDQSIGRDLLNERRLIEEARQRSRQPDPGAARRRGPWAPTNIDPRSSLEEARRRQQARRLEEERRLARERQQRYEAEERRKELARQEEEARRLQEERWKEAARREEEVRTEQSRRYEEERKRLEEARLQDERRRQETWRQRGWGGGRTVGGTRQPEATRSPDQDPRLQEHRRIQDSRPIPSYLVRDDARRLAEKQRQEERARLEAERRRQEEESRRQKVTDSWRQQEIDRLHALPVSARIILRPGGSTSSDSPGVLSRGSFENEIEFAGINPGRQGVKVTSFPAPPTSRPPAQSPGPCVWAVVQCCSRNNNRLINCFESMGCPGVNWDPNPCRRSVAEAARAEVMKFYAIAERP